MSRPTSDEGPATAGTSGPSDGSPAEDPTSAVRAAGETDRLLHEPARLSIATALYPLDAADFVYLARATGLTKGNLSSHLVRLESAGYVEIEKTYRGKVPLTLCRLTDLGRRRFDEYREHLRRLAGALPEGRPR